MYPIPSHCILSRHFGMDLTPSAVSLNLSVSAGFLKKVMGEFTTILNSVQLSAPIGSVLRVSVTTVSSTCNVRSQFTQTLPSVSNQHSKARPHKASQTACDSSKYVHTAWNQEVTHCLCSFFHTSSLFFFNFSVYKFHSMLDYTLHKYVIAGSSRSFNVAIMLIIQRRSFQIS